MERKGLRGGAAVLVGLSASVAVAATAVAGAAVLRFADELQDYNTAVGRTVRPRDGAAAARGPAVRHDGRPARARDRPGRGRPDVRRPLAQRSVRHGRTDRSLGHYNADVHAGHVPVVVSTQTEVWLDFTVDATGAGDSSTAVRFPVDAGASSVVVHAAPTDPATGLAGPRLACLPVEW